ncbi:GntR family transcriptional regulator [Oxalobacteraceae bacterium A2-2]
MPALIPIDKPRNSGSSADIAHDIAEAIAARKLPPGTRLREEALCRLYSVSRTKIRAALLILSKDKLINAVPDKGAFVAQPSETESREIFATRRIVEGALAHEFVARAKAADYRRLEKHLKEERCSLDQAPSKARQQLLGDFHVLLADVVGNQVLREIVRELVGRSTLITMLYQSERDTACSADEHRAFLDAAKAGDADQAARIMLDHLHHVEAALDFGSSTSAARKDLVSALLM